MAGQGERDIASAVASVAAFPVVAAGIIGNQPAVTAAAGADSSFAISLPPATTFAASGQGNQQPQQQGAELPTMATVGLGSGYVLLLTDPGAAMPRDRVRGVIAIEDGNYHIVDLPTGTAESDIDLGQLVQRGDEAQSSLRIGNGAVFDVPDADMASYALMDNVYKDAKNIYCNHDASGDFEMHPQFMWNLDGLALTPNAWTPVDSFDFEGYGIQSRTNKTSLNLRGIADGSYSVKMVPPEALTVVPLSGSAPQTVDFLANTGMRDAGYHSSDRKDWINSDGLLRIIEWDNGSGTIDIGIEGRVDSRVIPEGWWSIVAGDGRHLADFDLGPLTPFDAAGQYRFVFPSVKFSVDADNYISRVDVRWYLWDADAGRYIDATGSAAFSHLVSFWFLSFTDGNGTTANGSRRVDFRPAIGAAPGQRWKYFGDPSDSEYVLEHAGVFLQIGSDVLGQGTSIAIGFHP